MHQVAAVLKTAGGRDSVGIRTVPVHTPHRYSHRHVIGSQSVLDCPKQTVRPSTSGIGLHFKAKRSGNRDGGLEYYGSQE